MHQRYAMVCPLHTREKDRKEENIPWPSSTVNKENAVYPLLAKK
jgi:hypothetical protein